MSGRVGDRTRTKDEYDSKRRRERRRARERVQSAAVGPDGGMQAEEAS